MGESIQQSLSQFVQFAEILSGWDSRIVEIIAVGGLVEDEDTKTNLVCRFEPEPPGDVVGLFLIANLMVRDEFEGVSERLEIEAPFDLGLQLGENIHLPGGEIIKTGETIKLWPTGE